MIDIFLLGVIATASLTASLFFLKFWRATHDAFFGAFAAFFCVEAGIRVALLFSQKPNEGSPSIYLIRLLALILLLGAILEKNYGFIRSGSRPRDEKPMKAMKMN